MINKQKIAEFLSGKAFEKPGPELAAASDQKIARWAKATVKAMAPNDTSEDLMFRALAVLVASSVVGAHEERIAKMLDYPLSEVLRWGNDLRHGHVWKGTRVCDQLWFHPQCGRTGLMLDAMVAVGLLERFEDVTGGDPFYEVRPLKARR